MKSRYQTFSAIVCLLIAAGFMSVGYLVAPVLFSELGQKQAGQIAAVLFNQLSLIALIGMALVLTVMLVFEKQLKHVKSLLLSFVLLLTLKFWISPWMADIKERYPQGLDYASADWQLFASLHGIYQLLYLIVVSLLLYWSIKTLLTQSKSVVNQD